MARIACVRQKVLSDIFMISDLRNEEPDIEIQPRSSHCVSIFGLDKIDRAHTRTYTMAVAPKLSICYAWSVLTTKSCTEEQAETLV